MVRRCKGVTIKIRGGGGGAWVFLEINNKYSDGKLVK